MFQTEKMPDFLTGDVLFVGARIASVVEIGLIKPRPPVQHRAAAEAAKFGESEPAGRAVITVVGVGVVGRSRRSRS